MTRTEAIDRIRSHKKETVKIEMNQIHAILEALGINVDLNNDLEVMYIMESILSV